MIHASRRAPGTLLYACLCAAFLLGCCGALLVALCGPPVWAREIQGWVPPEGAVSDPEPPEESTGPPEESESAADPDLDPETDPPVPRRSQASSSLRTLRDGELPPGVRERLRARIARQD